MLAETSAAAALISAFEKVLGYDEYLAQHREAERPERTVSIAIGNIAARSPGVEIWPSYEGFDGPVVVTGEGDFVEWAVDVEEGGWYNIAITYYPLPGNGGDIQREIWINGEVPFYGARFLTFHRVWVDGGQIRRDNRGNELRPPQVEAPAWRRVFLSDDMGYLMEPYNFYFHEGTNLVRLVSLREPVAIGEITLTQAPRALPYEAVRAEYASKGYQPAADVFIKVQGEHAKFKSSPTLYADVDRSDPLMEPYDPTQLRLNYIGGHRWQLPGQWITWEVEVPQAGLYQLAIKAKQDLVRGTYSNRRLLVNGEVPFAEAEALRFRYGNNYQMHVLGPEGGGEPYLIYLNEGKNAITLEVVLGDLGALLQTAESALFALNEAYRQILMVTSSVPDPLRDYRLDRRLPHTLENMREQAEVIERLARELESYTGQKGSHVALLDRVSRQLRDMVARPYTIPERLAAFRDNLGGLGTWILQTRNQPLKVDYLVVASPDKLMPRTEPTAWERAWHEVRSFASSFFVDYNVIGDFHQGGDRGAAEPLKVWIAAGRDQAISLKEMIEDTFTPATGIRVNLELVNMGILLPATLAGLGPDVALGLPASDPINFALRGALVDLTEFDDFEEIQQRFLPSAFTPFTFRDQVFAVPEQQPFPMLFYRKDILAELGLDVPQTWDDVFKIIPELQKEHLNMGLPVSTVEGRQAGAGDIGMAAAGAGSIATYQGVIPFLTLLYQSGGSLYREDGIATNLDSEVAVEAFRKWTELYELYQLPLQYDLANRFRTGEIPIILTDYPFYNLLSVFAPEIRGRWDFTLTPGTLKEDGTIDRTVPSISTTGTVIMKNTRSKEAAWEFVKWWTSTETQVRYGRELESLMGPAARYPTANRDALLQLPWTFEERQKLVEQWGYVRGVPEVPGGYMVGRHLDNAFRKVVYQKEDPRETLLDYVRVMNEEIRIKRQEFGLDGGLD